MKLIIIILPSTTQTTTTIATSTTTLTLSTTNILYRDLGITLCASIPVAHCYQSYALLIDGTPFGRIGYSGDCRPSERFVNAAIRLDRVGDKVSSLLSSSLPTSLLPSTTSLTSPSL